MHNTPLKEIKVYYIQFVFIHFVYSVDRKVHRKSPKISENPFLELVLLSTIGKAGTSSSLSPSMLSLILSTESPVCRKRWTALMERYSGVDSTCKSYLLHISDPEIIFNTIKVLKREEDTSSQAQK